MTGACKVTLELSDMTPVPVEPARAALGSSERRNKILAFAVVLLVLLIGFWPSFEREASQMDEGTLLVYPEMLQRGKLPYRDFETFYGPANPVFLAAAFTLFGSNIFVERAVGLLYRLLILLAIFVIAQSWGKTLAVGCLVLAGCLLLVTYLPAFAWFGAMACALWSLQLGRRAGSNALCFFAGALAGCALLFRVDVGPAMIISALPLLHGMTWPGRRRYVYGAGVALLPLGILTLFAGWQPVLENLFLTPVLRSGPARHLPLFSAEPYVLNLFFANMIAVGLNITAGIAAGRSQSRDDRARLFLSLALFGLGVTYQAAQRLDLLHLLFAGFVSLAILPLSLVDLWSRFRGVAPRKGEIILATIAVIALLQGIAPELTIMVRTAFVAALHSNAEATFAERNGRAFPSRSPEVAETVARMLVKLEALSAPGERLFVGPADLRRTNYSDTYLYYMMPELTPATYFLEMNPSSANRPGSRLAADVQTADWLVLNRAYDRWSEPNRSSEYASSIPNTVVQRDFEVCGEFGSYLLCQRRNRAGSLH